MSDSSELEIRPATESDLPQILAFIRALADYERLADAVVATEEGLRQSLFGTRAYAECVIALWNGMPAGFALFFHNFSTFLGRPGLYLEDLFVQPELRGKGVGRALLAHLAKLATDRNCGRLEWSVLDWNEPAIAFYKSIGAEPMNEWTIFRLQEDALTRLGSES